MNQRTILLLAMFLVFISPAYASFTCNQQTANISSFCAVNGGSYTLQNMNNPTSCMDGNISTYCNPQIPNSNYTVIYNKPGDVFFALWNITIKNPGFGDQSEYFNIPDSCLNAFDRYIKLYIYFNTLTSRTYYYCYTDETTLYELGWEFQSSIFYEESIDWGIYDATAPNVNFYNPLDYQGYNSAGSVTTNYTIIDFWPSYANALYNGVVGNITITNNTYCYLEDETSNSSMCNVTGYGWEVHSGNAFDGNWNTYISEGSGFNDEYVYQGYFIPDGNIDSILLENTYWQIKDSYNGNSTRNISLGGCEPVLIGPEPQRYGIEIAFFLTNYSGKNTYEYYCYPYNGYISYEEEASATPLRFYEEAVFYKTKYSDQWLNVLGVNGTNSLRINAYDINSFLGYDQLYFRVRSLTSNISNYTGLRTSPPVIGLTRDGWLSNVTCGAYTNSSYLYCGITTTNTINCNFNGTFKNTSIKVTPYCYDDDYLNASSYNITVRNGILDNLIVNVFDAQNFSKITQNVTLRLTSNISDATYTINGGNLTIGDLYLGLYSFRFNTSNYTTQTYTIMLTNTTIENKSFYLLLNSSAISTIFTVKDRDSGAVVSDALVKMYSLYNNTWYMIASQLTDYTGKTIIKYVENENYKFIITKELYNENLFYLNPILYATYDIFISMNDSGLGTMKYDKIGVYYPTNIIYNGSTVNYPVRFYSPYYSLTTYGITLDYPGGIYSTSAIDPAGSTIIGTITINSPSLEDFVNLTYYYTTSAGTKNFTVTIPIIYNVTRGTFLGIQQNTYGMGTFERILIAVIISIFVVGIATMLGQLLAGLGLGFLVLIWLSIIGFVPIWAIAMSLIVGFFLLTWRTGGY